MSFSLEKFINARPFLYHLTASQNLAHIRQTRLLRPAAVLMKQAGRTELLRQRRPTHEPIQIGKWKIVLRDQSPLHRGNLKLLEGTDFEDFIESLNSRVFFWPGRVSGPTDYGVRHFERYQNEHPAILRVRFQSLIEANPP